MNYGNSERFLLWDLCFLCLFTLSQKKCFKIIIDITNYIAGITQLVSGLSSNMGTLVPGIGTPLVAPLVVSQPQRAVVPCNVTTVGTKGLKATAVGGNATSVPLVPAQYATSLTGGALGGLVKPVVVVSAPAAVAGMMAGAHTVASGKP